MSKQTTDRFDQQLREWADRPAELSPKMAAQRVRGRLEPRRQSTWLRMWRPALAVASLVALAVVGWWQVGSEQVSPDLPVTAGLVSPPSSDVLVLWLDSETPLYLTLAGTPPEPQPESHSGDLL